ncbi:MAG: ATPase [Alphaproteobacteria bacterium]|nr:MAG: ATPase [Alphaproteobacteria bacterium]
MDASNENGASPMTGRTNVERPSDREIVVTRTFAAPPRIVFKAWSTPELFMRWWAPKSLGVQLLSCEMDVRTGGKYRLEFGQDSSSSFVFFGKYLEVIPNERIVWTNEEETDGAVTTVTFEEKDGKTLLVLRDVYPTREAFEAGSGSVDGLPEQFAQLDDLLATLAT